MSGYKEVKGLKIFAHNRRNVWVPFRSYSKELVTKLLNAIDRQILMPKYYVDINEMDTHFKIRYSTIDELNKFIERNHYLLRNWNYGKK